MVNNPFNDSAITNYEQYKHYSFIPFNNWEIIKSRINTQISQIKNNKFYGERSILIGLRGIGKTTTLFAIKDMLEKENIQVELFSRLIEDADHFNIIAGKNISSISSKPVYILIDFPDTVDLKTSKRFLEFLWSLMIHKNYDKINLIFAMNQSHYEKSFTYSEILGKFTTIRLEKLSREETGSLIESRLGTIGKKCEDYFDEETITLIYNYSKGIPRNIISACFILVSTMNGDRMIIEVAEKILKEKYVSQVINDRVENLEERMTYNLMFDILKNDFNGRVEKQFDYIEKVREKSELGQNTILSRIDNMVKWGLIQERKGGEKRTNKILSLN